MNCGLANLNSFLLVDLKLNFEISLFWHSSSSSSSVRADEAGRAVPGVVLNPLDLVASPKIYYKSQLVS